MSRFLRVCAFLSVCFFATNAFAAGYTCDSSKEYSSCNAGYYLSNSQCLSCESGCTCPGGTEPPECSSTVTFDLAGGDWGATSKTQTVANNSTMTIVYDHFPSRAGYTFGGFYTGQNCTGTQYFNGESDSYYQLVSVLPFASDTSLYACWETCPAGSYCPGGGIFTYTDQVKTCPAGTSVAGSDSVDDCKVTVTFKSGNTVLGTQQVAYNTATMLTPEAAFTAPVSSTYGWNFDGWATSPNASASYIDIDTVTLTNDITLYGVWSRGVSFKYYDGASATSTTTGRRTQYYQNTSATAAAAGWIGTYPLTTQTTYNWAPVGWVLNSTTSTTTASTATTTDLVAPAADAVATYYALYKRTATVAYDGNGNTGGSTANTTGTQYYNAGGSGALPLNVTLAQNGFTKTGYTFDEWAGIYFGGQSFTFPNTAWTSSSTYSLAAEWLADRHTVSFSANGGSGGQTADVTAIYDSAMPAITATKPTRIGCKFMGWYDNATYTSGTQYYTATGASARTWNKTANTTLYAGWSCMTVSPQPKTMTYNGSAQSCATTFTVSGPSSYTVTYSTSGTGTYSATAPTLTNVGSTTVFYKVAATDYTPYEGSYTCTMSKATMNASLAGNSKTYDGSALTCNGGTQTGVPNNSTITYGTSSNSYGSAVPTVTNVADSKTIFYKITNDNYYDFKGSFSCTVNKADWEEMGVGHSKVYDGTSMECTGVLDEDAPSGATIRYGTTEGTYDLTTAPTATSVADSKTVYFQVTHPNYVTQTGSFSCTIERATGKTTLGATSGTLTYPTTSGSFTASCSENATPEVSLDTATYASASYSSGKVNTTWKAADGTTKITVSCPESPNYNASSGTYTLYTKKAANPITLSTDKGTIAYPNSGTFTVSGAQGTLSVSSSATGVATAAVSGTTVTVQSVKPGSATVTVTASGNSYYYSGSKDYVATIIKGTPTLTLSESSGTLSYTDSVKTKTVTVSKNTSGGTLSVSSNATGVATAAVSGTTVTMTYAKAGTATITVTSKETDYYNAASATYALTVNCGAGYYSASGACTICGKGTYTNAANTASSCSTITDGCYGGAGSVNACPNSCSNLNAFYTKSDSGRDTNADCYGTTTATKYVAEAGKGQVACTGGYCPGGTKVYYATGNGSATGGRSTLSNWTCPDSSDAASDCYRGVTLNKNSMSGTLALPSSSGCRSIGGATGTTADTVYVYYGVACKLPTTALSGSATGTTYTGTTTWATSANAASGFVSSITLTDISSTTPVRYAGKKYTCSGGYYLKASTNGACTACPDASYCPGITDKYYSTSAQGLSACSALDSTKTDGTYSSVSPRSANTHCRFTQNQQPVPTYCQTKTSNTMSYSGTAWLANTYAVTAEPGSIIVNNNTSSARCTQCDGAVWSAGGTATSCSVCPSETGGWSRGSGTGWSAVTSCYQTKAATSVSSHCYSGQLKQNATSTTAWGTATVSTAFTADKGSYVKGSGASTTCEQCAPGTYQGTDGSTATSCTNAADGKYVADTGATTDVACALGSYSEKSSASTKCVACPAGRTTSGTGTKYNATANTACSATCSNASGANAWATPSWSANSVTNLCTVSKCNANTYYTATTGSGYKNTCTACGSNSSTSAGNTSTTCTCTTGYTSTGKVGGASTSTSGCSLISDIACTFGQYVPASSTTCEDCPEGHYCPRDDRTYSYSTSAQGLTECPAGTYQPMIGEISCYEAMPGYYASGTGNTFQTPCTGASYAANTGQESCTACPVATNDTANVSAYGYWNTGETGDHTIRAGCNATFKAKTLDDGSMTAYSCYVDSGADTYGVDGTSKTCWVNRTALKCNGGYYNSGFNNSSTATQYTGNKTLTSLYANACINVGAGYWSADDALTRTACESPLTTIGYGMGANEAADCGRILHAGSNEIYLRSAARTSPALNVKVGDTTFYGALSTSLSGALKVKNNGTTYSVVNDWQ